MATLSPRALIAGALWLGVVTAPPACTDPTWCPDGCAPHTVVLMDFDAGAGFFDAPFPSAARVTEDGRPNVDGFPNPQKVVLVDRVLDVLRRDARGFGLSSGVFFRLSGPADPASLPDLAGSTDAASVVQLVGVDPDSPDYLKRYPITVRFSADPGPYGAPNLLSLVPLQGVPLRPKTRYAALVTRGVRDAAGAPLERPEALAALLAGSPPESWPTAATEEHAAAIEALRAGGVDLEALVALTAFTTDDPTAEMARAVEVARADPPAAGPFAPADAYDDHCVFESAVEMPVYQSGAPPYLEEGGGWTFDAEGHPVLDHRETARIFVTIPRAPMPAAGYPVVVFSRTGGGGDRPLVDRGVHAVAHGEAIEPGAGPALHLARAGWAGASPDGPHGGPRNVKGSDEQFLVFNFQNPLALRDNVRQSALELALMPDILRDAAIDVSGCAGADAPGGLAKLDVDEAAIMGHSMGAAIAPLALVHVDSYRAILLSGAGGSFLENMIWKEKPIAVKPMAELILGLAVAGYELREETPILSMLQWAGEPADAPLYGRYVIDEPRTGGPRHVLMMQGIVDHYIMPPIADATSLSFGLDLGGDALEAGVAELDGIAPLPELLPLVAREQRALPVEGNRGGGEVTAAVLQFPEDGIEDGHEVMFQTEAPKHAYRCFLSSLALGSPRIPRPGAATDPCD